jgi:hypothetical protein
MTDLYSLALFCEGRRSRELLRSGAADGARPASSTRPTTSRRSSCPRAPELNPVENVWRRLRQNWLANTVFEDYDAIVDAACAAWRKPIAQPETITLHRTGSARIGRTEPKAGQAAFRGRLGRRADLPRSGDSAFSSNNSASFSVIAPPSSSASTIVTARR